MRWRAVRHSRPIRYYFGDDDHDYAFVVRNGMNPDLWDVTIYNPPFGTNTSTLREGKRIVEERLVGGKQR